MIGTDADTLSLHAAWEYGGLYAMGTNVSLVAETGTTNRVYAVRESKVALVHAQVYAKNGFNAKTAVSVVCSVNTKPFTAIDKYLIGRYFQALGITNVVESSGFWRNWTLKPMSSDNDLDGIADGWEHYIVNSVVPERVIPASHDTGFVNIITEVNSGGAVSVPATWMVNFPNYVSKFGDDFIRSLMKLTGKRDGAGNAMCVWQDYVAGTDPTDEDDVFTASVTIVDGRPVISYTPELKDAEKALRVYKTWGKVRLQDANWVEVPDGHNADYNFFKVTVEMK